MRYKSYIFVYMAFEEHISKCISSVENKVGQTSRDCYFKDRKSIHKNKIHVCKYLK